MIAQCGEISFVGFFLCCFPSDNSALDIRLLKMTPYRGRHYRITPLPPNMQRNPTRRQQQQQQQQPPPQPELQQQPQPPSTPQQPLPIMLDYELEDSFKWTLEQYQYVANYRGNAKDSIESAFVWQWCPERKVNVLVPRPEFLRTPLGFQLTKMPDTVRNPMSAEERQIREQFREELARIQQRQSMAPPLLPGSSFRPSMASPVPAIEPYIKRETSTPPQSNVSKYAQSQPTIKRDRSRSPELLAAPANYRERLYDRYPGAPRPQSSQPAIKGPWDDKHSDPIKSEPLSDND